MSVYIAARTTVTDRNKYENEILPAILKIHEAHGAKVIAAGYIEYLVGEPAEEGARVTIIECPNEAAAQAIWNEVKPVMEAARCTVNPRISLVPAFTKSMATA
jgi:uncharacterized protein (DUF1330 family)